MFFISAVQVSDFDPSILCLDLSASSFVWMVNIIIQHILVFQIPVSEVNRQERQTTFVPVDVIHSLAVSFTIFQLLNCGTDMQNSIAKNQQRQ